jgi:DNA-binding response OmpR family regulator
MKIACCFRDAALASKFAERLVRNGLHPELHTHEVDLMRSLRRRADIALAVVQVGTCSKQEDGILSWLSCRAGESVPVLLVAPHWTAERIAAALEAGADDCMVRPFDFSEALARIRALMRRAGSAAAGRAPLEVAGFVLDPRRRAATDQGAAVALMPREFALAWLLFANVGRNLSLQAISMSVWGTDKDVAKRTLEQHVYKLRKKLNLGAARGVVLRTTYGQGYRLDVCEQRLAPALPDPRAAGRSRWLELGPGAAA